MVINLSEEGILVIGGGIAGIQASLDLAEMGYKVYLVERSPSIGGVMAQLDKTFPTNDCSICILAPKMVEVARHQNIELLTYSEVKSIKKTESGFKALIYSYPRYVDADKYSRVVEISEVKENDCNLSVTRYVDIFDRPDPVDIQQAWNNLKELEKQRRETTAKLETYLKELGYEN